MRGVEKSTEMTGDGVVIVMWFLRSIRIMKGRVLLTENPFEGVSGYDMVGLRLRVLNKIEI